MGNEENTKWTVAQGLDSYVLELKKTSLNTNMWVMWSERNGEEVRGSRSVKQRLDSNTKKWFGVN